MIWEAKVIHVDGESVSVNIISDVDSRFDFFRDGFVGTDVFLKVVVEVDVGGVIGGVKEIKLFIE